MLIAEYDYQTDIEVQREEAWEDGHAEGKAVGIISTGKKFCIPKEQVLSELMSQLGVDENAAKLLLDRYWDMK
ncbi:MAG: hypothetical protein IJ468_10870 [Lachnospiraceae bacterium]|nr:hypothetical protein [Lachnospiraceae bacterium]